MDRETRQDIAQSGRTEALGRLVRLTWKTLGGYLLCLLLILILVGSVRQVEVLDVIFWLTVAGLVLARFADLRVFRGETPDEEPPTLKVLFGYSARLVVMSGAFWLLTHILRDRLH